MRTPKLVPRSDTASRAGRAGQDAGLAALLGGQLFGRLALHPAVAGVGAPAERGRIVNRAWRRYGIVNTLGLVALGAGWLAARRGEVRDANLTPDERRLARMKDVLTGAAVVTGVATGIEGARLSRQAPDGAVPMIDGDRAAPEAGEKASALKRRVNRLGAAMIATELGLVTVNAALSQAGFRQSPLRRRFLRGR